MCHRPLYFQNKENDIWSQLIYTVYLELIKYTL
jgi:hypothetical protein